MYKRQINVELEQTGSDAISNAAAQVVNTIRARAIVTHTRTGNTAYRAARERPAVPIMCVTQSMKTARAINLVWGVHAVKTDQISDIDQAVAVAADRALSEGFAKPGETLVMTAGVPFGRAGSTNTLRIVKVPSD